MSKQIMLTIFLILILGLATGVALGVTITQSQFDAQNFEIRSLEINIISKEKNTEDNVIIVELEYKTLELESKGLWEVVLKEISIEYDLEIYHTCRVDKGTKEQCIKKANEYIKDRVQRFKRTERNYLESQKTKKYNEEITIDDITITNEELNTG